MKRVQGVLVLGEQGFLWLDEYGVLVVGVSAENQFDKHGVPKWISTEYLSG